MNKRDNKPVSNTSWNTGSYYKAYFWIADVMRHLNLKPHHMAVFGIINGFHESNRAFDGSLNYLAAYTMHSRSTVQRALSDLVDTGLIEKMEFTVNHQKRVEYRVNGERLTQLQQIADTEKALAALNAAEEAQRLQDEANERRRKRTPRTV